MAVLYHYLLLTHYVGIIVIMLNIIFVRNQKPSEIQKNLLFTQVSMLIILISYTCEMQSRTLGEMLLAAKFGYIGKTFIVISMLFVVIDYCQIDLRQEIKTLFMAFQMLVMSIVLTNDKHHLFYKTVEIETKGLFPHLYKTHGLLYNIYTLIIIGYAIAMIALCVIHYKKTKNEHRKKVLLMLILIALFPYLGFAFYFINGASGYDATVLGYLISNVGFVIIFRNSDIFATVNIAFHNVVRYLDAGLIVYDTNGDIIHINNRARELKIVDKVETLYNSGEYFFYEDKVYKVEKFQIVNNGVNYGYAYYVDNETSNYYYEKKLEDEKSRADIACQAKTEFLASMSHDIRTPMNAILGMSNIAKLHIDDKERVEDCLSKIDISGNHLLELINEVLDMNKIESGELELNEESFNLLDMIDQIEIMTKPLMEGKNHTFKIDTENVEHTSLRGDRSRLSQIIMNLLSNAVKYTNEGGNISLSIYELGNDEDSATYKITVKDNGIGMSEEYLPNLFDPFTRAKDENVYKSQGTGLGMAITKKFADLLGATINVESELKKGTTFTVIVGFTYENEKEVTKKKNLEGVTNLDFTGKNILLAEDNEINSEIATEILSMAGFNVIWAVDGEDAVNKFSESEDNYFSLIFMDIQMPKKTGFEATMAIRAIDSEYAKNIPIIAMTANAFVDDIKACKDAGMNNHIAKPIDLNRLYEVLSEYCS